MHNTTQNATTSGIIAHARFEPESEAESDEGPGSLLVWGGLGAAGGVGAVLVVVAASAVTAGIVLSNGSGSSPAQTDQTGGRDPHTTATRWTATGIGY